MQPLQASQQLARAELEAAKTGKERLTIHQRIVALAADLERAVQKQHQAGQVTAVDLLQARYWRLEAEIALEQAKGKHGTGK